MILAAAAIVLAGCKGGNKKADQVPLPADGEVAEAVEGAAADAAAAAGDAAAAAGDAAAAELAEVGDVASEALSDASDAVKEGAAAAEAAALEAVDAIKAEVDKAAEAIEPDGTILYQLVEVKPTFKGGDANDFTKWVNKRISYPDSAKKKGIEGRVGVQFTVAKDGTVKDVKVAQSADPALDAEAVRVISSSPKWTPGSQNGKPVDVKYMFPVVFKLNN